MTAPTASTHVASLRIGVLALQGDVREHLAALITCGAEAVAVRRPDEIRACDGLVLPGGESTAIVKLAEATGVLDVLREFVDAGRPVFGTCAGMVLLADRLEGGVEGQRTVGGLDVTVRRNGFGRQVDSFEEDLDVVGVAGPVRAVFIRAPWVVSAGPDVEILARSGGGSLGVGESNGRIVAVRQGSLLAASFHPEVGGDSRLHQLFVDMVRAST